MIKEVAAELGNTPAVCRKSYVHPAVIDAFVAGQLELDRPARSSQEAVGGRGGGTRLPDLTTPSGGSARMHDVADAPPSDRPARRRRWWLQLVAVAAFVAGAVALLRYEAGQVPDRVNGDAWEYWYQAESFHRHGSPELWPEDVAAVNGEAHRLGLGAAPVEPYAYATAPDGRMYGVHFWAYALSAVPAEEYLRRTGGSRADGPGDDQRRVVRPRRRVRPCSGRPPRSGSAWPWRGWRPSARSSGIWRGPARRCTAGRWP